MKTSILISVIILIQACFDLNKAIGQWSANGNDIYNSNTGNVGIGNSTPGTLLYVAKNMTEPTVTVRNPGGPGGATYSMIDDASGANWKFKATAYGGFKIRDHANGLDIITIEQNSFTNALYVNNAGSIGIGTANPDNSALVDMLSVTKGVLIPRMTQSGISAIASPSNGLMAYCTTDDKLYGFVASANAWKEINFVALSFACGNSLNINHVAGNVAPVNKPVTYATVNNVPGEPSKCWITSNLGADYQASSVNDATEQAAGWCWQFNRQQGFKHDGSTRTPNTAWINAINENSDWTSGNDPCNIELGSTWRLPTNTEWSNVMNSGGWIDWNGPWNSLLKLHAAGYLDYNTGALVLRGSDGSCWSSTQYDNQYAGSPYFYSGACYMGSGNKAGGLSVRCLQ